MSSCGQILCTSSAVDELGVHAERLVLQGALALIEDLELGVRHPQQALERLEQVEVELAAEFAVHLLARLVELDGVGGLVVRANDGGVAAGAAAADIGALDDRDVGDPEAARKVVSGGEAVTAPADDDDVVGLLHRLGLEIDPLAEEAAHSANSAGGVRRGARSAHPFRIRFGR